MFSLTLIKIATIQVFLPRHSLGDTANWCIDCIFPSVSVGNWVNFHRNPLICEWHFKGAADCCDQACILMQHFRNSHECRVKRCWSDILFKVSQASSNSHLINTQRLIYNGQHSIITVAIGTRLLCVQVKWCLSECQHVCQETKLGFSWVLIDLLAI